MMPMFRVLFREYRAVDIEAENAEQAEEKFDDGDFPPSDFLDAEVDEIEEIQ
jgi:hypothetical protein